MLPAENFLMKFNTGKGSHLVNGCARLENQIRPKE